MENSIIQNQKWNPYLVTISLTLFAIVLSRSCGFLIGGFVNGMLYEITKFIIMFLVFYLINQRFLKVKTPIYSKEVSFRSQAMAAFAVILIVCILLLGAVVNYQPKNLLPALETGLTTGILEEYLFRGFFIGYFLQTEELTAGRIRIAVFFTTLLFALTHLNTITVFSLSYSLLQVFGTGVIGLLSGAVYVRTKSLIWGILYHAIWNFSVMIMHRMETTQQSVNLVDALQKAVPLYAICLPIVLFLLRTKKLREIHPIKK
ncbi:CPBP family intramembrane glutamic endopeptidase [Streptococcus dentiloxodontae]